jgi:hypothetical protein
MATTNNYIISGDLALSSLSSATNTVLGFESTSGQVSALTSDQLATLIGDLVGFATLDSSGFVPVAELGNVASTTAVASNTVSIGTINTELGVVQSSITAIQNSKGVADGLCPLNSSAQIASAYLPVPNLWQATIQETVPINYVTSVGYPIAYWQTVMGNSGNLSGYDYVIPAAGAWLIQTQVIANLNPTPTSATVTINYTNVGNTIQQQAVAQGNFNINSTSAASTQSAMAYTYYNCSVGDRFRVLVNLVPNGQSAATLEPLSVFSAQYIGQYQ